jgi:hypothetical protein
MGAEVENIVVRSLLVHSCTEHEVNVIYALEFSFARSQDVDGSVRFHYPQFNGCEYQQGRGPREIR